LSFCCVFGVNYYSYCFERLFHNLLHFKEHVSSNETGKIQRQALKKGGARQVEAANRKQKRAHRQLVYKESTKKSTGTQFTTTVHMKQSQKAKGKERKKEKKEK